MIEIQVTADKHQLPRLAREKGELFSVPIDNEGTRVVWRFDGFVGHHEGGQRYRGVLRFTHMEGARAYRELSTLLEHDQEDQQWPSTSTSPKSGNPAGDPS